MDVALDRTAGARRQRVDSAAAVASRAVDGRSVLATLDQRGGAKIRLPRSAAALEAVLINTAGGLTGGDAIGWHCTAGTDSRLVITTAAAEKLYRSDGEDARQTTRLAVDAGARLDWVPQETIVFDGGRLTRTLEAELTLDATLLVVEPIVFGRHAMGERMLHGQVRDRWRIRRDGRLIHAEALSLDAARDLATGSPAGYGERFRAAVTVVLCTADDEHAIAHRVERLRSRLPTPDTDARFAVSALPGRLVMRGLAANGHALRRFLEPALEGLIDGPMPRVWRT